jgi:hypothetical protein
MTEFLTVFNVDRSTVWYVMFLVRVSASVEMRKSTRLERAGRYATTLVVAS